MVYILNGHRIIDENRNLRIDIIRAPTTAGRDRDGTAYSGIQGATYGFTAGGFFNGWSGAPTPQAGPPSPVVQTVIDRFPFGTFTTATDVGDLAAARYGVAGQSSSTHGYSSGGIPFASTIESFPFAQSSGTASGVGNLSQTRRVGGSYHSETHGYNNAGSMPWPSPTYNSSTIDKFPFASNGNSSVVGTSTQAGWGKSGQSSASHGYVSGYFSYGNVIEKNSFVSDGNASDVGDLQYGQGRLSGQSSTTHGYASGFESPQGQSGQHIQKFPFASDANAVVIGHSAYGASHNRNTIGQSSTTDGHISGGERGPPPGTYASLFEDYNVVHRFPFSVDADATDVGDLSQARNQAAGHQV